MGYIEKEYSELLNNGFAQLENEYQTIEIVQRLRKGLIDMDRVDFNLQTFQVFVEL